MSIRKARAWATFWTGVLIVALALIVEVLTMPKYNNYDLPELPASEYKNAYIAVSGDTAYLYFVDKKGYIEVDPNGLGNTYTLGLTTADPYDETKILFAEKYTATIGGDSWTAEELPDLSGVYDIPAYAQFSLPCEVGGPVWSNVTLLDQYGNVFIEGSQPIDVVAAARRRYSYTLGYLMGLCAPPLKLPDKQPTAYSYNGVVLPKLPEWDKTVYPYAVMTESTVASITKYEVRFYRELFAIHDAKFGEDNWSLLINGDDYLTTTIRSTGAEWSALSAKALTGNLIADNNGIEVQYRLRLCNYDSDYVLWSNHTFNGPNREKWIVASDPIPVYE